MYFKRLRIENWKNFKTVDIALKRRVFIVGPNASGKSNLLDVFSFLREISAVGGGFQEAVVDRGSVSQLRCLTARRYSDIAIHVEVEDESTEDQWIYELEFNQDRQRRQFIKREYVSINGEMVLNRPDDLDKEDPVLLSQTHLEQVNSNRQFRPLAEFLSSIRYHHLVPQLMRDPERSVGQQNDPFGGDFLEQLALTQDRTRKSRMNRIQEALRVAVPQLQELQLTRDETGTPHLRGKYQHWRPQGAWQDEKLLSDGTLRLFGLLWTVLDGSGPLLLEEPEVSLHPAVVRYLPQLFTRAQRRQRGRQVRQIILSTHSADLLSEEGIGMDEVLLLTPTNEGTEVMNASQEDIEALLNAGFTMADAVLPKTQPKNASNLTLFD